MRIHITNGDNAGAIIQHVVGDEPVLPWRDVLHEGPIPAGLSLPELSAVRAEFIVRCGWGTRDEVFAHFRSRDAVLLELGPTAQVTLWFEHDLYDQLQLLQALDFFGAVGGVGRRLCLVQADRYLGAMSTGEMAAMRAGGRPVRPAQLTLARTVWRALREPTPVALAATARARPAELPFLAPALERLLAELPRPRTGLARTEELILDTLKGGESTVGGLYKAVQAREWAIFMGDLPFFRWLERLGTGDHPLITGIPPEGLGASGLRPGLRDAAIAIAPAGRAVLAGEADWVRLRPPQRWLGGTELKPDQVWRFDPASVEVTLDRTATEDARQVVDGAGAQQAGPRAPVPLRSSP